MADKPSLRFADGGSLITRWARSVMRPDATANRLRQAEAPAPAPAAPPPPPPKVQDPSRVTANNPAGIRFQDGGVVPGKGKGDKIPAKYEPGEFVVSNDMIDDNPGLREELSSLRAETLARRGKTVAEADAGIVTSRGLRAMDGVDVLERPMTPDDRRAFIRDPGPGNPRMAGGPSTEAQAWQQGRAAPVAAPTAAPTAAPATQGKLYGPGRAAGSLLRAATPFAAIGGAIDGLNTDTEQYAKRFGLENTEPGLLRDAGIRALGVASDIGNNLTFGMAGNLFRDKQEGGAPPAVGLVPSAASAPAPAPAPASASAPMRQPAAPVPPAAPAAPGAVRRVDGGSSPLFTNLPEGADPSFAARGQPSLRNMAAADALAARYSGSGGGQGTAPTGPQNLTPQTSGSGYGLLDADARRERSLRMDAQQLKPGSRMALKQFYDRQAQGDRLQSDERVAGARDETTRRGQDLDLQSKQVEAAGRFGAKQAELQRDAALRQATAAMWQQAGGDPEKFQDLAMRNGLTDAAKTGGDIAGANQNRRLASSKAAAARLESLAAGPDGKVDQNRLNQVRALANSISPGFESLTEEEQAVAMPKVLAAIRTVEGVNQLRDPTLTNMIGLSPDSPERRTLPDLKGASVEPVGILRGAVTPKVSAGDYRVTLANGNVVHLPRASTSEAELELLKAQGATLGTK